MLLKVKLEKGQPLTPHTLPGNFMMGLLFIDDFKHFSVILSTVVHWIVLILYIQVQLLNQQLQDNSK